MAAYKMGSTGDEVRQVQERLRALGLYRGAADGVFGGGTQAAVTMFQQSKALDADGVVGPVTWNALFETPIAEPAGNSQSLDYRCLSLTGAFETGRAVPDCFAGLSGDFDGQGISFGVLQWNFGQDSLQPLLKKAIIHHPDIVRGIFRDNYDVLAGKLDGNKADLMAFARSIQHPVKHTVFEPWQGMFRALGRTDEFQAIEVAGARQRYDAGIAYCEAYSLWSERAVALMFDIRVQNGSISDVVREAILKDFANLPPGLAEPEEELRKLQIIANRRADAANPAWIEDVRARKLCIANGGGGVHGISYDLEEQFGIGLKKYPGP